MSYIGNPIVSTDFPVDYKSGNGSTTAFTLSVAPASVNSIDVQISGVSQSPQTYSVSGTTLTFSAAPPTGTNNIVVRHLGVAGIPNTPSAASVVTTSIANNAVTPAKMANGGAELGMRNRIINGAMVIDQRNAGAAVTVNTGSAFYVTDRFFGAGQSADGVFTLQQVGTGLAGLPYGLKATVTTSDASLGATQAYYIQQCVEGFNFADMAWGTASAKTVTLSFWVYSSLTGTFGGSLSNSAYDRGYPFSYSIPTANTWTQISVTIAGDTTGTWVGATNGVGVRVSWSLGTGSTYSGTAGAWAAGAYYQPTGSTNVMATNGATFYITGVQLEVGTTATNFEVRSYGTELALCQRYFQKLTSDTAYGNYGSGVCDGSTNGNLIVPLACTMRSGPTVGFSANSTFQWLTAGSGSPTGLASTHSSTTSLSVYVTASVTAGHGMILRQNGSGSYITASAEL